MHVSASEAETDSVIHELDELDVVARVQPRTVMPVQKLDGQQLQQMSAMSVADALHYFAGVQIKDYGGVGGLKTVDVRSLGSHHLGVFYDGIEVGNAQNGVVDLGKFSLENIEEISLYNGQKTEELQPAKDYGSSGTLYIRSRKPVFAPHKPYNVMVGIKAGAFGLVNPSLLYEQKLSESVHLSVNAEYTYATGRYHFDVHHQNPDGTLAWDTTGIRQNGDIQALRAEVGLFGYMQSGKWHVKGYYYQSEKGIPRAIVRNAWTSDQRQWDRNAFCQGAFEYRIGKRWSTLVSAKYANDKMRYLNPDTTLVYVDNTFIQQEVYGSWANQVKLFDWWNLSLSADYIFNTLDADMKNFVYPRRNTELIAAATSFHYKWIDAQASVLGTLVQDRYSPQSAARSPMSVHKQKVTPAVFVSYQPLLQEQWFIRGFYKQTYRMPTFNDLYYTDIGNIHLEPEETHQYDVGMEYECTAKGLMQNAADNVLCRILLKADGYYNQVKNKIIAVPKGNSQYRWMMMNLGYVEIIGVDAQAGVDVHFAHDVVWQVHGTYTYQLAQDKTDPTNLLTYGGQIAYVPRHAGTVRTMVGWKGLSWNYCFSYVGTRYTSSANTLANQVPAWLQHDMSLCYEWQLPVGVLRTTVECNNLANAHYEIIRNYPMPGFNGKVVIQYSF